MQITREELNPCTVQLKIKVESDNVRQGFDRAFRKLTKDLRVPGFRPGKAPKHLVEQAIRPEALYEAAADIIIRDTFQKALEDEKLKPHSQPSVEITTLNKEEETCEFTAKVPLPPQVELSKYKGIKAEMPKAAVTDKEVDAQIEELRSRDGKRMPVTERGIQDGDSAVLNIKTEKEGGDGKNFMIIAGKTFKELDEAIHGMKSDEIKSLDLTFPKNFQEKDWAGKKHHVQVSVRSISAVQAPAIDEKFLKEFAAESIDQLKKMVRDAMELAKSNMATEYVNEQILENLLKESTIHVPDTMWEQVANRRLSDLAAEQERNGKTMEDYATENGMSIQELVDAWRGEAKVHVQRAVVVQKIFEDEKLQITNEDFNKELQTMAAEYNADPRELLEAMKKQNALQELQFRTIFRKVTDFLREHAEIKEVKMAGA